MRKETEEGCEEGWGEGQGHRVMKDEVSCISSFTVMEVLFCVAGLWWTSVQKYDLE